MTKSLEDRLSDTRKDLERVDAALNRIVLQGDIAAHFRRVTAFSKEVEHWLALIQARAAARQLLVGLEGQADADDLVPFGTTRVKYRHVRLIGVQAYLTTSWALADSMTIMVGLVLCSPDFSLDPKSPVQLVNHFVRRQRNKATAGALSRSVRQTFGWPIAISYALRNLFVHDGGQRNGADFFDGPVAASGFASSVAGWTQVEDTAKTYEVDPSHHRAAWPMTPRDDLRIILDVCEREMDDALGILVRSASNSLLVHLGCMVGED
jgi:hypothetical protein